MRSIFAGVAVVLILGACGSKAAGPTDCKDLFTKFDEVCKSPSSPVLKGFCAGKKADVEALKKTEPQDSCKALAGALEQLSKDAAPAGGGAAPASSDPAPK